MKRMSDMPRQPFSAAQMLAMVNARYVQNPHVLLMKSAAYSADLMKRTAGIPGLWPAPECGDLMGPMYELMAKPVDLIVDDTKNQYFVLFDNGIYGVRDTVPSLKPENIGEREDLESDECALESLYLRDAIRNGRTLLATGTLEDLTIFGQPAFGLDIYTIVPNDNDVSSKP